MRWWLSYRPNTAAAVPNRFLVFINALIADDTPDRARADSSAWLTFAALLFSNAIFHLIGAVQTRSYSPV